MALFRLALLLGLVYPQGVIADASCADSDDSSCVFRTEDASSTVLLQRDTSQRARETLVRELDVQRSEPPTKEKDAKTKVDGSTANLNKDGYASVLKLNKEKELKRYVDRVINAMGLEATDEKKVEKMRSKKPCDFDKLISAVLKGKNEDNFLTSTVDPEDGEEPRLNEDGYKYVVQQYDNKQMQQFIKRLADKHGLKVQDKGGLAGMAPFYSGKKDIQCFDALEEELKKLSDIEHSWLSTKGAADEKEKQMHTNKKESDKSSSKGSHKDAEEQDKDAEKQDKDAREDAEEQDKDAEKQDKDAEKQDKEDKDTEKQEKDAEEDKDAEKEEKDAKKEAEKDSKKEPEESADSEEDSKKEPKESADSEEEFEEDPEIITGDGYGDGDGEELMPDEEMAAEISGDGGVQ